MNSHAHHQLYTSKRMSLMSALKHVSRFLFQIQNTTNLLGPYQPFVFAISPTAATLYYLIWLHSPLLLVLSTLVSIPLFCYFYI